MSKRPAPAKANHSFKKKSPSQASSASKISETKPKMKDSRPPLPQFETIINDPSAIKKKLRQLIQQEVNRRQEKKPGRGGYLYLYDPFLKNRDCQSILANIEIQVVDFEMAGKVMKLSPFTNPRLLIEDELRRGVSEVVVVGNDETLAWVLTRAADLEAVFGFLPVGQKKNYLAKILGLPLNEEAVPALAARKIEKLDYGIINNNRFFLSYLYIPQARAKIEFNRSFIIQSGREKMEIAVANLLPPPFGGEEFVLHPQDGQMECYLKSAGGGLLRSLVRGLPARKYSIFPFHHLSITADKPITVLADGKETREIAVELEVAKKKLKMVVGRGRGF